MHDMLAFVAIFAALAVLASGRPDDVETDEARQEVSQRRLEFLSYFNDENTFDEESMRGFIVPNIFYRDGKGAPIHNREDFLDALKALKDDLGVATMIDINGLEDFVLQTPTSAKYKTETNYFDADGNVLFRITSKKHVKKIDGQWKLSKVVSSASNGSLI